MKTTNELFMSRARDITDNEIADLLNTKDKSPLRLNSNDDAALKKFGDHHLFKLLGGNAHAIILAAPLLYKMSLRELYETLSSSEMTEVLKVEGIQDSAVASLRVSLEASLQVLEREDPDTYSFFYFLGLLPGGVSED